MTILRSTRTTAVLLAASVLGALALTVAWATDGSGITTQIVSGPRRLGPVDFHTKSDLNEVKFHTKGESDVYVVYNTIVPGGHSGWHSHPGPSIISVKSGVATAYEGSDPNTPHVFEAGTCFVDDGEHPHIIRNEGSANLELVAFQILPAGAPRRIDQPAP